LGEAGGILGAGGVIGGEGIAYGGGRGPASVSDIEAAGLGKSATCEGNKVVPA